MTSRIRSLALLGTTVAAALALTGASAAAPGPIITVGTGCAVQCVKKALVAATATSATVELETTVLAHLKVTVAELPTGGTAGGLVVPTARTVSISAFAPGKKASFSNLRPETTYSIVVGATDLKGQSSSRKGTFATLPVKAKDHGGPTTFDSGAGCAAQCIQRALFTQAQPAATIARLDVRAAVDAKIRLTVSLDRPVPTAAGPSQLRIVSKQSSPGLTRSWQTQVGGLMHGTRYWAVVRATDAQGRTSIRQGSFRTVSATAVVTLHKLRVVADGDKGANRGELYFRYYGGGEQQAGSPGWEKIGSGSVVPVRIWKQPRPGYTMTFPANGDATFDVRVVAEECDALLMKNCLIQASSPDGHRTAWAGGPLALSTLLAGGALPPWYGTGVTAPAGHDGYFVLATKKSSLHFLVLGTVDVRIDWP